MCPEEKKYVDKGLVKYHYGNKGGLRYYGKRYGEFIEVFGDIGYIDLNIHPDNQNSFDFFLDKIAKVEENKWIKENAPHASNNKIGIHYLPPKQRKN